MSGPLASLYKPPPKPVTPYRPAFESKATLHNRIKGLVRFNEAYQEDIRSLRGQLIDARRMLGSMRQEIDEMYLSNQTLLKQLNELWQSKSRGLADEAKQQEDHNQNGHNHQRDLGDTVERLGQRHDVDQVGQQPEHQPDNDQVDDQVDERLDHSRLP